MKEIYLLRHGEKDTAGLLTEQGKRAATLLRPILPRFARVFSSDTARTILTAQLLTGCEPVLDNRAAYATTSAKISDEISTLAAERDTSFLDAARLHNDLAVLAGINDQARMLNTMVDELLTELPENERALVISHDLTIAPAMGLRGMPAESIAPLSGYIISMADGATEVRRYQQAS